MADSSPSSSSLSSSKLVYFVIFPLILLSGLVIILNQKPSSWLSSSSFVISKKGFDAPPPVAAPEVVQPPPVSSLLVRITWAMVKIAKIWTNFEIKQMMENKDRKEFSDLEKVEASLARARATIQEARRNNETSYDSDYVPTGPMYRDPISFHR